MAIKITPTVIPSLTMEHLHIDQFTLLIDRNNLKKKVTALGSSYALDAQGNTVFSQTQMSVNESDMDALMIGWAIAQGQATDIPDAAAKLAAARLAVTTADPSVFTLMAYFEQGVGKVFEIAGETVIVGVE